MKLISCTDFVLEFGKETNRDNYEQAYDKISAYARFLKQPLTLGMFFPSKLVNGEWVVLEEPIWHDEWLKGKVSTSLFEHCRKSQEYQEAKDRVLFEGFNFKYSDKFVTTVSNEKVWVNFKSRNIFVNDKVVSITENLVKYNLVLTESAKKQILGL